MLTKDLNVLPSPINPPQPAQMQEPLASTLLSTGMRAEPPGSGRVSCMETYDAIDDVSLILRPHPAQAFA